MKKLMTILTLVFTAFVGVMFSACGDKYKDLSIEFKSTSDSVVLVMDDEWSALNNSSTENTSSKNSCVVEFAFSGIKAKDIGEIKLQVVPADLAVVGEIKQDGNNFYAKITATKSGNGNIVLTHLATGKSKSVMLHVDKKAVSATSNGYSLVVNIPEKNVLTEEEKLGLTEQEIKEREENSKVFVIDADTLLNFDPMDATDVVGWTVDGDLPTGVEFGNFDEEKSQLKVNETVVNNQIKVSSTSNGGVFRLKPILKMEGYADSQQDFAVTVNVAKVLDQTSIEILSQGVIASNLSEDEQNRLGDNSQIVDGTIKLFANSADYKQATLAVFYGEKSLLDDESYLGLYDIKINKSCSQIAIEDDEIDVTKTVKAKTIVGLNYSANSEWIEFVFEPKKAVGDIAEFSVRLNVDLTEIATSIGIKMDGERLETESSQVEIDLLDYYGKYNGWGEKFNFEVQKTSTDSALKQMKIIIDKSLISSNKESNALYLLEFRKNGQELKFDEIKDSNNCVSEMFSSFDNIYVKYLQNNSTGTTLDDKELEFSVTNCYDGSYGESQLVNTEKTLTLTINRKRGLKSFDLLASNLKKSDQITSWKSSNETFYVLNSQIIDANGFASWNNGDIVVYGVQIDNIIGNSNLTDFEKSKIEFSVEMFDSRGKIVDCFDFYQYTTSGWSKVVANKFSLKLQNNTLINSIGFVKKSSVADGKYTIKISQPLSATYKTIDVYIVSNVTAGDLKLSPFDSNINLTDVYYNSSAYTKLDKAPNDWENNFANYFKYNQETKEYSPFESAETDVDIYKLSTRFENYLENAYILPTNKEIATTLMAGAMNGGEFVENSSLYQYISSIEIQKTWIDENGEPAKDMDETIDGNYLGYSSQVVSSTCRTGAIRTYKLGTVVGGDKYYIRLTYQVKCKQYLLNGNDFYELSETDISNDISVDVFVYVPINETYLNNKMSTTSAYFNNDNLGYYYKDWSKIDFKLNVINPNSTAQNMLDYLEYNWVINESLSAHSFQITGDTLSVQFKDKAGTVSIIARIKQFGKTRDVVCYVTLKEFSNTQNIVVRNNLKTLNDSKYVSLKLGDTFKFDVDVLGIGTDSKIKYVVCDNVGKVSTNYKIDDNGNLVNINKDGPVAQDLKVIIFAKDWLSKDVDSEYNVFDFNDLTEFLIASKYADRVKVVELKIRNGQQNSPFLISEASELRDIATRSGEYYYQLTNDINMSNVAINLGTFNGHLNSYIDYQLLSKKPSDWSNNYSQYYTYSNGVYSPISSEQTPTWAYRTYYKAVQSHFTIYNVTLGTKDNNLAFNQTYSTSLPTNTKYLALFDSVGESASIKNITFALSLNGEVSTDLALAGIVGANNGELSNVAVEINGTLNIIGSSKIFIGGLVGKNLGKIINTDPNYVYTTGELSVVGNNSAKVYVGGLVGLNAGSIEGVLPSADQGIEYALMFEEQGSLYNANISLTNTISSTEQIYNSALGGVVGVNLGGTIYGKNDALTLSKNETITGSGKLANVYSSGRVTGADVVGGMIGLNVGENEIDTSKATISNSLSTTKVVGSNYVGGLVGFDVMGTIYNSKYEVYNTYSAVEGGTSVVGEKYVGGLVGRTYKTKLDSVYFHSFRWTYDTTKNYTESEFFYGDKQKNPDIKGKQYVGGLIGYAYSDTTSEDNQSVQTVVKNAIVSGYILGEEYIVEASLQDNYTSGLIGYAYNILTIKTAYVRGLVQYSKGHDDGYKDIRLIKMIDSSLSDDTANFTGTNLVHKLYSKDTSNNYALLNNVVDFDTSKLEDLITKAPTSIDMKDSVSQDKVNGTTEFLDGEGKDATLSKTIMLYYYDLSNKSSVNYSNDIKTINTILLDDFIAKNNIKISPENIGVRLKVVSTDTSVVSILANGSIRLYKEGVAVVRFYSVINPNIYDEITMVVRNAPTNYEIYSSSTITDENILNDKTLAIIKDTSKYIYENYTGEITVNNTTYNYNLTSDVRVWVEKKTEDDLDNIEINNSTENKLSIDNKEPIIITATGKTDNIVTINMTPYIKFELNGQTYLVKLSGYNYEQTKSFNVETKQGATNINLDVTDAVISVGDEMDMSFEIETDTKIDELDMSIVVKSQYGNDIIPKDVNGNEIDKYKLFELWTNENKISGQKLTLKNTPSNNIQTENFTLKVNQNLKVQEDLYLTITFRVQSETVVMNLTIIPQKITSIVATNFKDDNGWSASSIIRPGKPNMIVIDVAPDIAYFDYLEITDTNTQERIGFIQFDKFNSSNAGFGDGKALSLLDEISCDGYGIKLKKQANDKRFYVYTLVDILAEISATHKLNITAYSSSGYVLGSTSLSLEVTTFPSIVLTYVNAKGQDEAQADSRLVTKSQTVDLAIGVEAQIKTRTINIEGDIEWSVSTDYQDASGKKDDAVEKAFSIEQKANGNYYLIQNIPTDYDLAGRTVIATATVQKMTNGHKETGSASFNFVLRKYTLNGVSIKSDIATSQNRVGGVTNKESTLEFYFDKTDISYCINNSYWNQNYFVDWSKTDDISKLLQNINELAGGVTLKLKNNNTNEEIDLTSSIKDCTSASIKTIQSKDGTELIKFSKVDNTIKFVPLTIRLNNWSFEVTAKFDYDENIPKLNNGGSKTITSTFGINISEVSSLFDYIPVSNQEEFLDMVEGNYYILADNITLNNYEPLDINLGGFDGNGHTITIKSFDYSTIASNSSDKIGYFGLFKEIYDGEIVKNLQLKYELDGRDLCEYPIGDANEYYTQIYFGGIAPISNGIITNSIVEGKWNFSASQVAPSNFNLAGIVCQNTGYITNTTSKLTITAGGFVGGIAIDNSGKISTSVFGGEISSYSSSTLSSEIKTAGFVLNNSGEISLSAVQNMSKDVKLESAGSIGGFVYNNSGSIYDCCVNSTTFASRGQVGGFVFSSTGTILRSYINTSTSLQGDRSKDAFVFDKTGGVFENCYYVMDSNVLSGINGVNCILKSRMNEKSSYNSFIWTDDDYGVWKMTANGPMLTSAYTLIETKSSVTKIVDGKEKTTYIVAGTKAIPYLIYNAETYEYYMSVTATDNTLYGYFRLVADVDLSETKDNPTSSKYAFAGTLEGNNMSVSGFGLYGDENVSSLGLFKETDNALVNNLSITTNGIRASNTSAVGILAGTITDSRIYNINIDANNSVVMGKNAVGGLAGIIKGSFNINGVYANVVANSIYRQTIDSRVNIYNGKFEYQTSNYDNLSNVSYAGAVAGIVDGYDNRTYSDVKLQNYYKIKNVKVSGNTLILGEMVGGAFGFVGERTLVDNIVFDATTSSALKGIYYAGGIAGENRGIIQNSQLIAEDTHYNLFDANMDGGYANICGGIVALNNGGLVWKCKNTAHVISTNDLAVVGGVVARNINGTISDSISSGAVYGYLAGGICGTDYSGETMTQLANEGAVTTSTNRGIATKSINYSTINSQIGTASMQGISIKDLKSWYLKEKEVLIAIGKPLHTIYSYGYNSSAQDVTLKSSKMLAAVVGKIDSNYTLTVTGDIITLSRSKDFKINVSDFDGDTGIKFDDLSLYSNNNLEYGRYNKLQSIISKNKDKTIDYFFICAVSNESGDIFNSNTGYSKDTCVVVFTNDLKID